MKSINSAILAAALTAASLATASAGAFAQDAMTKADTKKSMSMEDCRSHANTAMGQKANDTPANADTDKKCADMTKDKNAKAMKKNGMKKDSAMPTQDSASGAMK